MAWSSNNNSGGEAAAGRRRPPVVDAGKAGKTGPGQTKPRLGTTGKVALPSQSSPMDKGVRAGPGTIIHPSRGKILMKWVAINAPELPRE